MIKIINFVLDRLIQHHNKKWWSEFYEDMKLFEPLEDMEG